MNLLPLRGGLPSHFVFSNGGLVAKHLMIANSARLRFSAPNEKRLSHRAAETRPSLALLIPFFTLFRRHRCRTANEYQYEHKSNCNADKLFHRFLLMKLLASSSARWAGPSPGRLRLSRKPMIPSIHVYPVRKPRCLRRRWKIFFFQRTPLEIYLYTGRTRSLMPCVSLPVGKCKTF